MESQRKFKEDNFITSLSSYKRGISQGKANKGRIKRRDLLRIT